MAILVSCDPGGIKPGTNAGTGYAVLDTEDMSILHMEIANHNPGECVRNMKLLRSGFQGNYVLSEGFSPRWGQPFSLDSVYLIGAMQGYFEDELKLVMPSAHTSKDPKKAAVPVAKLSALMKSQGYAVGKGHSRMALSVAVYYAGYKLRDENALAFLAEEG